MLYGGVVADRVPRRTLMIVTQTAMMLLAFILAALTFLKLVQPWHILVMAFLLGVCQAFDAPARQAFVLEMVEREDLTNAIALNGAMFNSAVAVGPAASGIIYALAGPAWCFLLNGLSFIAVIGGLLLMRLKPFVAPPRSPSMMLDLREGLRYSLSHSGIRAIILVIGMMTLFGYSFWTLIPAWSVTVLGGDATTNGWMQAARGFGALACALVVASLGRFSYRGRLLTAGTLIFPLALLCLVAVRWLPAALAVVVVLGGAMMVINNTCNALIQTLVDDRLRGRVMGVYSLVFFGAMPLGGLLVGSTAERLGEPLTLRLCGLVTVTGAALIFLFIPRLRKLG
jgi:MFS family permease